MTISLLSAMAWANYEVDVTLFDEVM